MTDDTKSIVLPEDEFIPTECWGIMSRIIATENQLTALKERYNRLIERAVVLGIEHDNKHVIVRHERNLPRIINPELAEKTFPKQVELARKRQIAEAKQKAKEALENAKFAGDKLKIGVLQKLLTEKMIDEISYPHEIVTTYEVMTIAAKIAMDKAAETAKSIAIASAKNKRRSPQEIAASKIIADDETGDV